MISFYLIIAGVEVLLHLITLNETHTHTLGGTRLKESACRRDLYLTTHNTYKRQTFMPPSGLESTIPVSERPQTHALDRAATGIGYPQTFVTYFLCLRPRDSFNPVVPKACSTDPKGSATVPRGCFDTVL